jgi:hypothetical protein
MKLDSVGRLLCSRELTLVDGRAVVVIMGMPQRFSDGNDDYFCPYQITGIGSEQVHYGAGVDPFQAVWLTMQKIGAWLYACSDYKGGRLSWLGQSDLGFPVPDSIRDVLP